ncbi:MAG: hypothetical protein JST40_00080 [Armatimonadetes bacterium]|nr:hypothetical protein [Armatimonadota bacterium]
MMKDSKSKKMLVLGALGLVLVGVGAFQVIGGGSPAAPKKAKNPKESRAAKESKKKADLDHQTNEITVTEAGPDGIEKVVRKVDESGNVVQETRVSDDGKVQSVTEPETPSDGETKLTRDVDNHEATSKEGDPSLTHVTSNGPAPLAVRDPFAAPSVYLQTLGKKNGSKAPSVRSTGSGGHSGGAAAPNTSGVAPLPPMGLGGVAVGGTAPTPVGSSVPSVATNQPAGSGDGKIGLRPGKPLIKDEEYGHTVSGVVTGGKPAVILQDASGKQTMATVGQTVDGGKVVEVTRGYVVVEYKGKRTRLKVGGGSGKS